MPAGFCQGMRLARTDTSCSSSTGLGRLPTVARNGSSQHTIRFSTVPLRPKHQSSAADVRRQVSICSRHTASQPNAPWSAKAASGAAFLCRSSNGDAATSGNGGLGSGDAPGASSRNTGNSTGSSTGSSNGGGNGSPPRLKPTASGDGDSSSWALQRSLSPFAVGLSALLVSLCYYMFDRASSGQTVAAYSEQLQQLSAAVYGSSEGLSLSDSFAAVKRLLRELFQEQLGIKQRIDSLEKAANEQIEAADEYQLQLSAAGSGSSSLRRSPVRISGCFSAAGVLPWSQEPSSADAVHMLSALGASGQADGRVLLHSALAGGKRRVTAELSQADGSQLLRLHKLLYRIQLKDSFQLMIAPLGGSLDALAKNVTPIHADYGCTHALRRGHGLSMFDSLGSGKAATFTKGRLQAAAGHFVGGSSKTSLAQLQLRSQEGQSLSLVAAHQRPRGHGSGASSTESSSSRWAGVRFLGVQAPGIRVQDGEASSSRSMSQQASTTFGVVGALPIRDASTATAWAEKPTAGAAGWGLGLYTQPDPDGMEMGLVLAKPSSNHKGFRDSDAPVFCEVSAKVPVGDGLSISPGALLVYGSNSKATLAYTMQSSWRF